MKTGTGGVERNTMQDQPVRPIRGQIIEVFDAETAPPLVEFAQALSAELGQSILPVSVRVSLADIVKLKTDSQVRLGDQTRIVIPATLNKLPVVISHRYPLKPPLMQKLLLFSTRDVMAELELELNSRVRVGIAQRYFARAHILDWGRSLSGVLNAGIDR